MDIWVFQSLDIMSKAAMTIRVQAFSWTCFHFSWVYAWVCSHYKNNISSIASANGTNLSAINKPKTKPDYIEEN